jgi:hypothetical protein
MRGHDADTSGKELYGLDFPGYALEGYNLYFTTKIK